MLSDRYMWVECPQCHRNLLKLYEPRTFIIEIRCGGCKGDVRVVSSGTDIKTSMAYPGKYWPPPLETK